MHTQSHTNIGTGREHTSRAKDPAIVEESQKIIGIMSKTFWFLALVLIVWWIVSFVSTKREEAKAKAQAEALVKIEEMRLQATVQTAANNEVLKLRFEGTTPCSTNIHYRAQIWGDGPEFWVKFPGVNEPVKYGRGKFASPNGVQVGETTFTAVDSAHPVMVRVYEKVTIR